MSVHWPESHGCGNSHLRLARRNNSVTGNKLGEDTTSSLNSEGQGADINQYDIFGAFLTGQDTTLDSSTVSNSLIGVDTLRRFLAEVLLQELLNLWNTGGTPNKDNLELCIRGLNMAHVKWFYFIDVLLVDFGILQYLLDGFHGLTEQVHVELLEFGTSECL